jgi:hypothetical protein
MNFDQMPTQAQFDSLKQKGYLNTDFNPNPEPVLPPPPPMPVEEEPVDEMPEEDVYTPDAPVAPAMPVYEPSPELLKAEADKERAIKSAAIAGEAQAAEEAAFLNKRAEEQKNLFQKEEAEIGLKEQAASDALAKLETQMEEASKKKVDPNQYWAEKSTGQKIFAGITLALGAIGAGFTGRNDAATIITNQIEADIQRQRQNIESEKEGLGARKGIYKDMLSAYNDKRSALNASKIAYLKGAEMEVEALKARAKGTEIKANADVLLSDLRVKRANETEALKNRQMQLASMKSGQMTPDLMDERQLQRYVPGQGLALDKESAKIMREATVNSKTGLDSIKGLLNISKRPLKSVSLEDRKEAQVLATSLKAALRSELIGPGAVSESEWKLLDSIVANPTNVFSLDSSNEVALKTLGKKMQRNLAEKAKMYIYQPQGASAGVRSMPKGGYDIVK